MTETPQFEGPLRNPDISEDADREWDKATERMSAEAARRLIPEFSDLETPGTPISVRKHQTAAEQRLPHAKAILEGIKTDQEARLAREEVERADKLDESLKLLRETDPAKSSDSSSE